MTILPKDSAFASIPGAIPRTERKRQARPGVSMPEKDLQSLCEQYARSIGLVVFHLPQQVLNAAFHRRNMSGGELGAARYAADKIKGYPDLTLFYGQFFRHVELKTEIGKLTHNQEAWLKATNGVCLRSFEEFKDYADMFKALVDKLEKVIGK